MINLGKAWSQGHERLSAWLRWRPRRPAGEVGPRGEECGLPLPELPRWEIVEKRFAAAPAGYRDAFTTAALPGDSPLFAGREEALAAFEHIYQQWQNAQPAAMALVGPDGCGLTTLLNRISYELAEPDAVTRITLHHRLRDERDVALSLGQELGLPATESLAALRQQCETLPPRVILVDNAHQLFFRGDGDGAAVTAFLSLLTTSAGHFGWVLACREQAWHRLMYAFDMGRHFTETVRLDYFREEEFKMAWRKRLETAALPTQLVTGDDAAAPADEAALNAYLDTLYRATGGNLRAALYHWRHCLHFHGEQDVALEPCLMPDYAHLRKLSPRQLLSLTEILVHGGLSLTEYSALFLSDPTADRLALDLLVNQRVLERSANDDGQPSYHVDPMLYAPITNLLVSAHMLY